MFGDHVPQDVCKCKSHFAFWRTFRGLAPLRLVILLACAFRLVKLTFRKVIDGDSTHPYDVKMEDVRRIRRERLRRLLDEQFPGRGGQALLVQVLDRQTGYISRCLNGEKPIGEVFARHVEQALHLPRYWLDGDLRDARPMSPRHATLLERFDALTPGQQVEFLDLLERVRRRNEEIFQHLQRKSLAPSGEGG